MGTGQPAGGLGAASERWVVGGLMTAPACRGASGELFGCMIRPFDKPLKTPTVEDVAPGVRLVFDGGESVIPTIERLGARFRFDATHEIRTEVHWVDRDAALKEANRRFRATAASLAVAAQRDSVISAGLEEAVLITWCQCPPSDPQNALGLRQAFGALPTSIPSDASRTIAGTLSEVAQSMPVVRDWLIALYDADERAFLSDEGNDDRAVLDYCLILESVAGEVARLHKRRESFHSAQRAAYETTALGLVQDLSRLLVTPPGGTIAAGRLKSAADRIRKASTAIGQANLESAWHRIEFAATQLLLPEEVRNFARLAWRQRSRSAAHSGDRDEPSARWEARIAVVAFVTNFIVVGGDHSQGGFDPNAGAV